MPVPPLPGPISTWDIGDCCCPSCVTCVQLTCCGGPVAGITVDIYDHSGGTLLASGTSGANGKVCTTLATGTYYVVPSGGGTCVWTPGNRSLVCNSTITIVGTVPGGVTCCGTCAIPSILTLTDSVGSCTLTLSGSTWAGSIMAPVATVDMILVGGVCKLCQNIGMGTKVVYTITCSGGVISVLRGWSCIGCGNFAPGFWGGSFNAACNPPVDFGCSPFGFAGNLTCCVGNSEIGFYCGNTGGSSGSATATCNPFTVSVPTMAINSDPCGLGDPVGGGVMIS